MIISYILDNDQPATCPKCGARTDFEDATISREPVQLHWCLWCGFVFIGEFEDELEFSE